MADTINVRADTLIKLYIKCAVCGETLDIKSFVKDRIGEEVVIFVNPSIQCKFNDAKANK